MRAPGLVWGNDVTDVFVRAMFFGRVHGWDCLCYWDAVFALFFLSDFESFIEFFGGCNGCFSLLFDALVKWGGLVRGLDFNYHSCVCIPLFDDFDGFD